MPPRAYIETTIVSYLTSRPSGEPLSREHQQLTRRWWEQRRQRFELYVSEIVLDEAARGDPSAAESRRLVIETLPILRVNEPARQLAAAILASAALPIATVNAMDFLLTWNCTHIANGIVLRTVGAVSREMGFEPPIVCTPEELMEG